MKIKEITKEVQYIHNNEAPRQCDYCQSFILSVEDEILKCNECGALLGVIKDGNFTKINPK